MFLLKFMRKLYVILNNVVQKKKYIYTYFLLNLNIVLFKFKKYNYT